MSFSLRELAHPYVCDLATYEPGKPIEDVAREMGLDPADIIKLASNENPLGPSPLALAAMERALRQAHIYPDGGGWALRRAIAERFGFGMENIVLGSGSNEIIELLGHAFLKPGTSIVISAHSFAVYKLMANLFGAEAIEVPDPGFAHDLEAMAAAIRPDTREVFITNPNNPTGTMAGQDAIDRFMARVPDHVVVVFDEAYYEFLDDPPDTLKYVREGRKVAVLRTFSKIQGLAGLRIGYGIAPAGLADVLQKCRQPFNTNAAAQAGALASLHDDHHQRRTKQATDEGRTFLQNAFTRLGLEYVPSHANFVMVKVGDANQVFRKMMAQGVIVRSLASYQLPEWIRITVGTMDENHRCLATLARVLEHP